MHCPFCAEEIKDEAIVCRYCHRDLGLAKPLIDRISGLEKRISDIESKINLLCTKVQRQHQIERRHFEKISRQLYTVNYIVLPVALIMLVHFFTLYEFHLKRIFIQLACIVIPLPFGFSIFWRLGYGLRAATVTGILIAVLAIVGTSAVVWVIDGYPILPTDGVSWRLTIEFAIGIILAMVAGNALANAVRASPRPNFATDFYGVLAKAIESLIGSPQGGALAARMENIERTIKASMAIAAGLGALCAGIKSGLQVH